MDPLNESMYFLLKNGEYSSQLLCDRLPEGILFSKNAATDPWNIRQVPQNANYERISKP